MPTIIKSNFKRQVGEGQVAKLTVGNLVILQDYQQYLGHFVHRF